MACLGFARDPEFAGALPPAAGTGRGSAWRATPTASGMNLQPGLGLRLLLLRLSSKCELPFAIAILAAGRGPNTSASNEGQGNGI
jgi:hypothetical protein